MIRPIEAREYKQILQLDRFASGEAAVAEFRQQFRELVRESGLKLHKPHEADSDLGSSSVRQIAFYDTPQRSLHARQYLLRARVRTDESRWEWTFKFRHPDRYFAAEAQVEHAPRFQKSADAKFEEDIGAGHATEYISRFSNSCTVSLPLSAPELPDQIPLAEAARVFPRLKKFPDKAEKLPLDTVLTRVGGQSFHEVVYHLGDVRFPGDVRAETGLIVWWSPASEQLAIVEFSFRYKTKREAVPSATAHAAYRLHRALQHHPWSSPNALTKTQFVYQSSDPLV